MTKLTCRIIYNANRGKYRIQYKLGRWGFWYNEGDPDYMPPEYNFKTDAEIRIKEILRQYQHDHDNPPNEWLVV